MTGGAPLKSSARIALSGAAALWVGACSGGGGGGGAAGPVTGAVTPPTPAAPTFPSASSSEYTTNWAIADVKAASGWNQGATGAGVRVAVIDDGVDGSHPELSGALATGSKDMNAGRNQLFASNETHGSEVSSLIAGRFNNASTVGVAFNASILALRADDGSGNFSSLTMADALDYARAQGARAVNLSLGASGSLGPTFEAALTRATQAGMIIIASAGNGGSAAANPDYPAFYATNFAFSNNLIIIAGAHDKSGQLSSFSSLAGAAQNFYLTAPGSQIIVPDFGAAGPTDPAFQVCFANNTCQVQGTSYSTPLAAGAVALLLQAFPSLTPQQIVNLLLTTADDIGAPGVDSATGRGRLNLAKAFAPTGTVAAPLAGGGSVSPASGPVAIVGAAFGDALARQSQNLQITGFDEIGRAYNFNLSPQILSESRPEPDAAPLLWRSLAPSKDVSVDFALSDVSLASTHREIMAPEERAQTNPFRARFRLSEGLEASFASGAPLGDEGKTANYKGLANFAGSDASASVTRIWGERSLSFVGQASRADLGAGIAQSLRTLSAVRLADSWRAPEALGGRAVDWSLTAGNMQDRGSLLGAAWTDRFSARPQSATRFVSGEASVPLTRSARLSVRGEWGWTSFRSPGQTFAASDLQSSAFAMAFNYNLKPKSGFWPEAFSDWRGALDLSVAQPLRIETGNLLMAAPLADAIGRTSLRYEARTLSIEPSGREMDLRLGVRFWLQDRFVGEAAITEMLQPGHIADADPETLASLGLRWAF